MCQRVVAPNLLVQSKICYGTLRVCSLCCETPKERASSGGHCKNLVISCWTLETLFPVVISGENGERKIIENTEMPLVTVFNYIEIVELAC